MLTVRAIEKLKPSKTGKRVQKFDTGAGAVPGFLVRANADGTRTFSLVYRIRKKQRRLTLGTYEKDTFTLADARQLAKEAYAKAEKNIDPADEQRADDDAMTFETLVTSYIAAAKLRKKTWAEDERVLTKIAKVWKHKVVKEIRRADVRGIIAPIAAKAPIAANRTLAALSACFNHAVRLGDVITENPSKFVDRQPERKRERRLTDDEVRELWAALDAAKAVQTDDDDAPVVSAPVARLLQFLLVSAQRSGETAAMRWDDVDFAGKQWKIPGTQTKNGRTHIVPLGPTALSLLKEAQSAVNNSPKKAQSAVKDKDSPFVFASLAQPKSHVGHRSKRAMKALKRAKQITFDATRHDLRRTAVDGMRRSRVSRDVVALVLNHELQSGGAATGHYDHYEGEREKREAHPVQPASSRRRCVAAQRRFLFPCQEQMETIFARQH
jgi:integrase